MRDAIRDDNWIKDLRHGDTLPLRPEFIRLNRQITTAAMVFRDGTQDTIRWNQDAKGQYTARSAYAMQFQGRLRSNMDDLVWKTWAPGNIKFFTWLLLMDRLWTNDCLQRRGWPNNYFCQLCVRSLESAHHLIWGCPAALAVWRSVGCWGGCSNLFPSDSWTTSSPIEIMHKMVQATQMDSRKGAKTTILLTCWEIWKERNDCTFKGKQPEPGDIFRAIDNSVQLWRQAGATGLQRPFWDPP